MPQTSTNAKKAKRLQEKAIFLKIILENYSTHSPEVAQVLYGIRPLFEKIESHQIEPPTIGAYNFLNFSDEYYEYNRKYPIISSVSANFQATLEDWNFPFPADERDTNALLKERIQPFIALLNKYAEEDEGAKVLRNEIEPLLIDIYEHKLRPPIVNRYNWWFTNKESPLFNKYYDLTEAAAIFDGHLEDGWSLSVHREKFLVSL